MQPAQFHHHFLFIQQIPSSYSINDANCCLSVCLLIAFPAHSKGVQGAKPPHKRTGGGRCRRGFPTSRTTDKCCFSGIYVPQPDTSGFCIRSCCGGPLMRGCGRKKAESRLKFILMLLDFLAATAARRGAQGRPRHCRPFAGGERGLRPPSPPCACSPTHR